jgi:hypothetical protein
VRSTRVKIPSGVSCVATSSHARASSFCFWAERRLMNPTMLSAW